MNKRLLYIFLFFGISNIAMANEIFDNENIKKLDSSVSNIVNEVKNRYPEDSSELNFADNVQDQTKLSIVRNILAKNIYNEYKEKFIQEVQNKSESSGRTLKKTIDGNYTVYSLKGGEKDCFTDNFGDEICDQDSNVEFVLLEVHEEKDGDNFSGDLFYMTQDKESQKAKTYDVVAEFNTKGNASDSTLEISEHIMDLSDAQAMLKNDYEQEKFTKKYHTRNYPKSLQYTTKSGTISSFTYDEVKEANFGEIR